MLNSFLKTNTDYNVCPSTSTSSNSRYKFVQELNANECKLFNRSFDTTSKIINKSGKLKQTKLCLSTSWKKAKLDPENTIKQDVEANKETFCGLMNKKHAEATQLFLMPKPQIGQNMNRNVTDLKKIPSSRINGKTDTLVSLSVKNGRNLLAILGRVDFCLEMHKIHKDINAIWNVYGKLLKITMGKQRYEFILLLRSVEGGPILQGVFYDFTNKLAYLKNGFNVRVVGRFIGNNRIHIYRVQHMTNLSATDEQLTRIQNATSFALLQNDKFEKHI